MPDKRLKVHVRNLLGYTLCGIYKTVDSNFTTISLITSIHLVAFSEGRYCYGKQCQRCTKHVKTVLELRKKEEQKNAEIWVCPGCGNQLTGLQIRRVRYDCGCPECYVKFERFKLKPISVEAINKAEEYGSKQK